MPDASDFGGGAADDRTLATADQAGAHLSHGFWNVFGRRGGADARKTVTFGDAGAVRSLPFWSLVSLILLIVVWWVTTRAWGFPQDFRDATEAAMAASDPPEAFTDRALIIACSTSDNCDESMYGQILGPRTFPTPADTWRGFNTLRTEGFANVTLWEHTRTSLLRVLVGMTFGTLVGVPIGFAMGLNSVVRGFFDTIVEMLRPIPPLALLPLFILWFGIGNPSSFALLIFASIWIMIIAARAGVRTVNLSKIRAAYSLGASKRQILFRLILPNALPELFTGFRVALGVSWGTLVAAELVGTDTGLGSMIFQARNFFRLDVMLVGVIVISVIGVIMDFIVRGLESVLIPWRGKGG